MSTKKQFASVWDAIETSPAKAENMKLRSHLMLALQRHIEEQGLTQTQAAKLLGVTQPRISNLLSGKIELFAVDSLLEMLTAAGLRVTLQISKAA